MDSLIGFVYSVRAFEEGEAMGAEGRHSRNVRFLLVRTLASVVVLIDV